MTDLATLAADPCTCGHRRGRHIGELGAGPCSNCGRDGCPTFTLDQEALAAMQAEALQAEMRQSEI